MLPLRLSRQAERKEKREYLQFNTTAKDVKSFSRKESEIMDMPEHSGAAIMWHGFYLGFGKGCEFMAEQKTNN